MKNSIQNIPRQGGAALVVGLIVLLIMTLLGISSMSLSISELKMANNLQMQNLGFQAALSASPIIREGKNSSNSQIQALIWDQNIVQPVTTIPNSTITSGSVATTATMRYVGCINTIEGYDISGSDQEGGSGQQKGVVQEIDTTANVLSGTSVLSTVRSLEGVRTIFQGCPP